MGAHVKACECERCKARATNSIDYGTVRPKTLRIPAEQHQQIAARIFAGETQTHVANDLGVSQSTISQIVARVNFGKERETRVTNPNCDTIVWHTPPSEAEQKAAAAAAMPVDLCPIYRWLSMRCKKVQAAYAVEAKPEIAREALAMWKDILNVVVPLAREARGAEYGKAFEKLADEMHGLAIHGQTPKSVVSELEKELGREKPAMKVLPPTLSGRRRQIAVLMAEGLSDNQIGERLGIAGNTVSCHLRFILAYCHARNRTVAVRRLTETGELSDPEGNLLTIPKQT